MEENACKKLCTQTTNDESLEAFLACRLIPFNKNPGIRPIGVGEVLRRIVGKVVVWSVKNDIIKSVGSFQTCAGHDSGCEATVHAMQRIYDDVNSEAVLLLDAANAFHLVSRNVFLNNIKVICPSIATFVVNCYANPCRLFVLGGVELKSMEGTTQGDPSAMSIYALAIIPLLLMIIEMLAEECKSVKNAGFADDISAAGKLKSLRAWWDLLCEIGPKLGYFP